MNSYEKNIDAFLELIINNKYDVLKIERTYKYEKVIEALYHKINNDNVLDFINTSVDYLELKSEHRDVKIKTLDDEKI